MSKVKIQGHASGTGILTVTAPNTSTDRTITLPDSTGTLATTADSVGGANGVDFNDNVKARFGTGNDAEIYHDGTHTYYKNSHTSGSTRFNQKYFEVNNTDGTESMLSAYEDGGVTLRYNNSTKLETTGAGGTLTGYWSGTNQRATTAVSSGDTSVTFSGIPAGVNRVTVGVHNVQCGVSTTLMMQLGTTSALQTSGYVSWMKNMGASTYSTNGRLTTSMYISQASVHNRSGTMQLVRCHGNDWACSGLVVGYHDTMGVCASRGALSGDLGQIKIFPDAGQFGSGGSFSITYD
jgi:hypothetical protein